MSVALAQRVSLILGAIYALIGLAGFTPAVMYPTDVPGPGLLFGIFAVNPVHNVAHLILGGLMIWAGMARERWDLLSKTLAGVFAVLVVGSLIAPIAEGIAINLPDTVLHAVTAAVFAFFAYKVPEDEYVLKKY